MESTLVALAGTTIAVVGTLLAPVLSQRLLSRAQSDQFERQERVADAQWAREQRVAERDKRRECYVAANAGYRRYRVELMNHLWRVHKGEVTPVARAALDDARHTMHGAFAEAQMAASDPVLAELDAMAVTLARAYDRVMRLEEADTSSEEVFEEIRVMLLRANDQWIGMRAVMRADLGVPGRAGPREAGP
ncbi:hypothetical protein ABZ766_25700 [Streptomyces sp. NPDC006670]|uniref:hypothetical protein n=1 Tax=Streptomyces sp. NPDC006670 TaxID=3154476 RepID=UPI0033D3701A